MSHTTRQPSPPDSFNPLAGIRCFLTYSPDGQKTFKLDPGFNPLAGIRCFLTQQRFEKPCLLQDFRFNPLAGIRCFLTNSLALADRTAAMSFNPLAGIRCFLTHPKNSSHDQPGRDGFNPLAGIRCFLTRGQFEVNAEWLFAFQSPSGDSLFSDADAATTVAASARVSIP